MAALLAVRSLRNALNKSKVQQQQWKNSIATSSLEFSSKKSNSPSASTPTIPAVQNADPPSAVFKSSNQKDVGPGASKDGDYKNPEYFLYHNMSYAEMEVVMAKKRLPQPSAIGN